MRRGDAFRVFDWIICICIIGDFSIKSPYPQFKLLGFISHCGLGEGRGEKFDTYMNDVSRRKIEATPHFFLQPNLLQLGNSESPLWLLWLL